MATEKLGIAPGPWIAHLWLGQYWQIILPTDEPLCTLRWINNGFLNRGVNEGTARAIAAVPELLAACEEMLANYGSIHPHDRDIGVRMMRAAIAKARGEEACA